MVQAVGACSGADISGYVAACDSSTATNTTCNDWFNGDASASCINCLVGPVTDAGVPTGQGGIWLIQGLNAGGNYPGCLDKKGMSACSGALDDLFQCIYAAGCDTCTDPTSYTTCENTVTGAGGACQSYVAPYQSACGPDFGDGGLLNGGPCSNDTQVLSVLCGNGSGDGG